MTSIYLLLRIIGVLYFFQLKLTRPPVYKVFRGDVSKNQKFWIASLNSQLCDVVDTSGHVSTSPTCFELLPALCTQSAPLLVMPSPDLTVNVTSSSLTITGYRELRSFRFLGIPFANPPPRWTYPTPFTGSNKIDATQFGPPCIQTGSPSSSEDCLTLNVFTPFLPGGNVPQKQLRPVMFWIHGGAFTGGSNSDPTFDGGNMASRGDVVFVNVQYRLSAIGFLALPDGVTNGNFGLADQIAALDWVREHIQAFGGDPNRITIFAIGKFATAIPMSNLAGFGFATTYSKYFTIDQLQTATVDQFLSETNCAGSTDVLACLKAIDPHTLVALDNPPRFPVVDGTIITHTSLPTNGSGPIANVHTMMGFMRDDGAAFIGFPTSDNLVAALAQNGLPQTPANSSLFPIPTTGTNTTLNVFNVTARVTTDGEFRCLDQSTAIAGVTHNLFKSLWFYEFNRSYQTAPGFDPNFPTCEAPIDAAHPLGDTSQEYFKCHSGELFYVFGTMPSTTNRPFRDQFDLPFMQQMLDIWTSFARSFNPNPEPAFLTARGFTGTRDTLAKEEKWTQVTKNSLKSRELQVNSFMKDFAESPQCDFLGFPLDTCNTQIPYRRVRTSKSRGGLVNSDNLAFVYFPTLSHRDQNIT
ncbi:AB hydrolase superfamily protein [Abortiporus biennis]